jgi:NTE family protein
MFQAVEIDGEPYWDGGNTILVQINPVERESSPRSASEILNRLNEVSFNAVLLKELRMMALLRQVADPGNSEGAQWAGMDPPHCKRDTNRARRFLQAQRGMGILLLAAR